MILEVVTKAMDEFEAKLEDLKETKTWITEEEREDVSKKMNDILTWLKEQLEAQEKVALHEQPVFKTSDVTKKMNTLKKLYTKVSSKKKPKPPKVEKKEEEEPEAGTFETEPEGEKKEGKPEDSKQEEKTEDL